MDIYEQCVMKFLTANGSSFVNPQLEIPYMREIDSGGSCPDFVVIRPRVKEVWVVEVTTTGSIRGLTTKFATAEKQWLRALRHVMIANGSADAEWAFSMLAFIRKDKIKQFKRCTDNVENLVVWPLEFTFEHWKWPQVVRTPEFDFRDTSITEFT